jgi:predicted DNA-binding protein (MmcQ/YjbR family)
MMTADEIINYCLAQPGAYVDFPFGDVPLCVKVKKRLFAQLYTQKGDYKITLNCDAVTGELYLNAYPGVVVDGYHCPRVQRPYFKTVYLNGVIPDTELKRMIDHSYSTVVRKLPQKVQKELKEER